MRSIQYTETNTKRQPKWGDKNSRPQTNKQEKASEKGLNKMEASNLSVMIIRILNSIKTNIKTIKKT